MTTSIPTGTIAPNGLDALDVIGVGDLLRPAGVDMTGIVMQDWKGQRLGEFGNPPGVPPMSFYYRADLLRVLEQEAVRRGIAVEYGKRLVRAADTPDGVTAHFADGTAATADVLIGADGIRSTVRTLIDPDAPEPRYAGLISFGARVDKPGLPSTLGKMLMSFGKQAFFGYQVFDSEAVRGAVSFERVPVWSRARMVLVGDTPGSATAFMSGRTVRNRRTCPAGPAGRRSAHAPGNTEPTAAWAGRSGTGRSAGTRTAGSSPGNRAARPGVRQARRPRREPRA